jgi:photosystem II stability/assembly factor-like uncharacterized protein
MAFLPLAMVINTAQAQWDMQESHTTASLRGIHNVGKGVAWASGTNGTVLRTEDGGYLWQTCTIPPGAEKLDFRGIQAFDTNTAIVMSSGPGDQSRLYKTTDGCQTWKLLFTNPDKEGFWDALQFVGKTNGTLLGDPVNGSFTVFVTSDGGQHWVRQKNKGLDAPSGAGAFAASNSNMFQQLAVYAFGTGGASGAFVYRRIGTVICLDDCPKQDQNLDGRKDTWDRMAVPAGGKNESSGIFSLATRTKAPGLPVSETTVIAVGGDYKKPDEQSNTAAWSTDGGQHWQAAQTPPHGYRSSVAYDPTQKLWITVGPNGTDISRDDGKNWTPLKPSGYDSPDADKNWNALSLPFVVGPKGRIGKLRTDALRP